MIDTYLDTFFDILEVLEKDNNVVLGGSMALQLHGINIGREPHDLDIILYKPTQDQIKYVSGLEGREEIGKQYSPYSKVNEVERHSLIVIVRKSIKMNILSNSEDLKHHYLMYKGHKVQSVDRIVEAKASYTYQTETKASYIRMKDIIDLQYIKNNNFNL